MTDIPAVSTVPGVKAALVDLMKSEAALSDVTVGYGDPGVNRMQREHIFLGDAIQNEDSWAPFGRLLRDEKYSLQLYIHAARPAGTQQEATERVYELFGVIALMVRPLARTATQVEPHLLQGGISVRSTGHREIVLEQGFAAFLPALFDIHARI